MTNHPQTLATFLQIDLYRIEAALEESPWTEAVATRLHDHLHRFHQLLLLATHATAPALPKVESIEEALERLQDLTEELLAAIATLEPSQLEATVLDPYERNLTLLAHLYDYTRLSAALVEWSQHLQPAPTLDDWFESDEES